MKYVSLPLLFAIGLMLWLSLTSPTLAQTTPPSGSASCGTLDLTLTQAKALQQQAMLAFKRKMGARKAVTSINYVPIRPHIIRRSNGTEGYPLAKLNEAMATTNSYYLLNGIGIQFYFAGTVPDYIDDDVTYEGFNNVPSGHDAYNAMNQYYINVFAPNHEDRSYASFPANYVESTRSVIRTYGSNGQYFNWGEFVLPHELGHNFGLFHTYGFGNGNSTTDELVTRGPGANCETNGDFICDTPADPYGLPGAQTILINNCYQYDPNSTARDSNGELYSPSISNLMSYWPSCTHEFTPGQINQILAGLALRQTHTAYTLDAPPTNVIPPSNLTSRLNGTTIVLTWQDNADNEMGYFIERSTSPTDGFVQIGGVAPDVTSFTDSPITLSNHFYYRIRPSNTTTGSLSPIIAFSTCPTPLYPNSSPVRISASLNWTGNAGQTNTLRWRNAGNPAWTTIDNIPNGQFSTTYSLTGLTANTAYEWQVQGVCSGSSTSDFTNVQSFTTLSCQTPLAYGTSNIGGASVQFSWYTPFEESGRTAEIRYRPVGSPAWTTVSSVSSVVFNTAYTQAGLANSTTYEWQVKNVCSATESSAYTPLANFTTLCRTPTGLSNSPTATRAILGWTVSSAPDAGTTYQLHYRPVGTTVWSNVNTIPGTGTSSSYSVTGLTPNTQYEWQVRTACSASSLSDYSITKQFTTTCNAANGSSLSTSLKTSTSVQLVWYINNDPDTPYEIRYRPIGAANWVMVSTTTNTTYNLTGLTNNTTYEWQIRAACSPANLSDFVAGPNFTTQCKTPSFLFANPQISSATLTWEQTGTDVTYDIHYRVVGTANWTTLSSITSASLTLTGLTSSTSYEYQVQAHCADGITTDFSSLNSFTTSPCSQPSLFSLSASPITTSSAQLNWYAYYAADIRYRVVGATDWITRNNLPSTNGAGSVILTGLSSSTSYEWQLNIQCSATENSGFSGSATFQTLTPCLNMYTVKDGLWNDPSVWSCNRLPTNGDVVQIKHQLIIPASYVAMLQRVGFDTGKAITYGTSAQLKVGF
ncbi:hypothetical protein EXU85_35165 [Spirosoma sp. KCTC 42546]|uniref:fibronectin type III domain-containing protein n=1 Tax=Spirosoma sp. KCTC 42546 TaxID=2520506 RepID=UPI001156DE49|nr:fibronectin type III domain-containing protein [Spirosoma sp. KCTC 42546]QDK83564.1 hypothetical protein EXU85_35165 [Spirosoma sp. KCTC 42546]